MKITYCETCNKNFTGAFCNNGCDLLKLKEAPNHLSEQLPMTPADAKTLPRGYVFRDEYIKQTDRNDLGEGHDVLVISCPQTCDMPKLAEIMDVAEHQQILSKSQAQTVEKLREIRVLFIEAVNGPLNEIADNTAKALKLIDELLKENV